MCTEVFDSVIICLPAVLELEKTVEVLIITIILVRVMSRPAILCLSSYFKGTPFIERAKQEGCHTILLTVESRLKEPWPRHALDEVFALKSFDDRRGVINSVAYLMRTRQIDRVVALDDFDVELGAAIREHFRLPGMYETTAKHFRDKLAMRTKALELGIPNPEFVGAFNTDEVRRFLARVPGPWLLKPRGSANAIGIQKIETADQMFQALDLLGDEQSFHLIEQMIPGELYHVDSIVAQGVVQFAEVNKYGRPLFDVYHGGGIYMTRTLPRNKSLIPGLRRLNEQLLLGFGMEQGVSHTEYMHSPVDDKFYLIETSARVGGANIAEMVEAATGVNLWSEWAKVEIDRDAPYTPPVTKQLHAGTVISLAKQEHPDHANFDDPEITFRLNKKHHIGFIVASERHERVVELLNQYTSRIAQDYLAVMPAATKATD